MAADHTTESFTIEGPDGSTETVELPTGLADAFTESGEPPTAVAADFLIQSFAQQTHALVHHSTDELPADMEAKNEQMEAIFEKRFGVSLADAMGHSH